MPVNASNANLSQAAAELGSRDLGNVPAWVAIALTALTMLGGCVAYIHMLMAGVHTRISSTRDWAEAKVAETKIEIKEEIATEREERRREQDRLERAIEGFANVGTAVTALVEGVKHLGERFEDHRKSNDRALDEIKHGMRNLDTKIQAVGTGRGADAR